MQERFERRAGFVVLALVFAMNVGVGGEATETPDDAPRIIESDPDKAVSEAVAQGGEVVRMRWKLGGFIGFLAGLFLPNSGDAMLSFVPVADDLIEIRLLITAPGRKGDFGVRAVRRRECCVTAYDS